MTTQPCAPILRRPLLGDGRARRHQREIDAAKVELLEVAAFQPLVAERDLDAHRPPRGDGEDLVGRELALGQDVEHLAPDIAGGADDGDFVTHASDAPSFKRMR